MNPVVLVDTGSSLNVLDKQLIRKMTPLPKMEKSNTKAYAFGQKNALPIEGKYTFTVESDSKYTTSDFFIIR